MDPDDVPTEVGEIACRVLDSAFRVHRALACWKVSTSDASFKP